MTPSSVFNSLHGMYGDAATAVRHEIFFTAVGPRGLRPLWRQALRATAALIRDFILLRFSGETRRAPAGAVLFITTLAGAGGRGALAPALAAARAAGFPVAVMLHPRLRAGGAAETDALRPPPPPPGAWLRALRRGFLPHIGRGLPGVSSISVAAAATRGVLWRESLAQALADKPGALVLHNDFDMMSAAALDVGPPAFCLQHGAPTAEFFPARAAFHVVWGARSAAVYRTAGVERAQLIIDALGRGRAAARPADPGPPVGVAVVSQTHTPVFGPGLAARFLDLASALAGRVPKLRVLLHPGETAGGHPYPQRPDLAVESPPHRLLSCAAPPYLVIGFCSTALIDAAAAGHYVVGLDWPADVGEAAVIGRPPQRVADADAALALFDRLVNDSDARTATATETAAWTDETFTTETGAFIDRLQQIMVKKAS